MTVAVCSNLTCGHAYSEHHDDDGHGCIGAVCIDEGIPSGPNAEPPSFERCYCPRFSQTQERVVGAVQSQEYDGGRFDDTCIYRDGRYR